MNLKLVKELEDLNQQVEAVQADLGTRTTSKVAKSIERAASEFKAFFESKGFSVSSTNTPALYEATYGRQSIKLQTADPSQRIIGAYARMDLSENGQQYMLLLVRATHGTAHPAGMFSGSDDQQLVQKIEYERRLLQHAKEEVESFDLTEWAWLLTTQATKTRRDNPIFLTFTDLLNHLFQ